MTGHTPFKDLKHKVNHALPCFKCNKPLRQVDRDVTLPAENQPYEGTAFTTHGHYGSTIFDPMDGQFLEINICDECLAVAADEYRILLGRSHRLLIEDGVVMGSEPVGRPPMRYWLEPGMEDVDAQR